MLDIDNVTKTFSGFTAVSGVSLTVDKQQIAAVIGPNGAGKSTFFNLITGHLTPDTGAIRLNGRDITGIAPHKICGAGMGRSFQRTNIFPKLTVFENVQAAYLAHRAGISTDALTGWRATNMPQIDTLDAALGALDLELAIVPRGTRNADGFIGNGKGKGVRP